MGDRLTYYIERENKGTTLVLARSIVCDLYSYGTYPLILGCSINYSFYLRVIQVGNAYMDIIIAS